MESTVWERILSYGRLSATQIERAVAPERVLKRVSCGCRVACSKGGGDLTNLGYIVQRCALFVLAKLVETDSSDDRNAIISLFTEINLLT